MTNHLQLIRARLEHLARMREYLAYSLGKTMRAVAIEEEQDVERFGAVLAFMERLRVLDSTEHWKLVRELRNAVNHVYEDDTERLAEFFAQLAKETPLLFDCFSRLRKYCAGAYGI